MNKDELIKELKDFKDTLIEKYLQELATIELSLDNYTEYNLNFFSKASKKVDELYIKACSKWKIGDRFKKIETIFYKNREEIVESIVWEITDIGIFWHSGKYVLRYEVFEDGWKQNRIEFPKFDSFYNLEPVNIIKSDKTRVKYTFERI